MLWLHDILFFNKCRMWIKDKGWFHSGGIKIYHTASMLSMADSVWNFDVYYLYCSSLNIPIFFYFSGLMTAVAILQSQLLSIKSECELHYFWILSIPWIYLIPQTVSSLSMKFWRQIRAAKYWYACKNLRNIGRKWSSEN